MCLSINFPYVWESCTHLFYPYVGLLKWELENALQSSEQRCPVLIKMTEYTLNLVFVFPLLLLLFEFAAKYIWMSLYPCCYSLRLFILWINWQLLVAVERCFYFQLFSTAQGVLSTDNCILGFIHVLSNPVLQ